MYSKNNLSRSVDFTPSSDYNLENSEPSSLCLRQGLHPPNPFKSSKDILYTTLGVGAQSMY